MKLTELIEILNQALQENGDMIVNIMVDGVTCDDIEINCPDNDSPLYIEGYGCY